MSEVPCLCFTAVTLTGCLLAIYGVHSHKGSTDGLFSHFFIPLRLLIGFQPLPSAISFAFSNSCASVYTGTLLRFRATIGSESHRLSSVPKSCPACRSPRSGSHRPSKLQSRLQSRRCARERVAVALAHTFRTVKYQVPTHPTSERSGSSDGLASCRHLLQLAKHRGVDGIFLYHLLRQVAFLPVLVHIGVGFVILSRALPSHLSLCSPARHSLSHLFFWVTVCRHKPPSCTSPEYCSTHTVPESPRRRHASHTLCCSCIRSDARCSPSSPAQHHRSARQTSRTIFLL